MRFPELVPKFLCKTDIEVTIYQEGISEDGAPLETNLGTIKCNYQDGAKTILTDEKKKVEITGKALFNGDICPGLPVISSGHVVLFGIKRDIVEGIKARNPDETVNYTELNLK